MQFLKKHVNTIKYMRGFKKMAGYLLTAVLCINFLLFTGGCGIQTEEEGTPIYFVNIDETGIESHNFVITAEDIDGKIQEMFEDMALTPSKLEYKAPLAMGFSINSYSTESNYITLDFDSNYRNLSTTTEVLVRAAIVKTLVQLPTIRYVYFTVDGEPLTDANGLPVGKMDNNTFIYNDGNAINTYEEVVVRLYFANEDGDELIGAYRDKFYSTNIPLELFVVEELISGPSGQIEGLYPTINSETNIISVTTSDGICYVNLDSGFLNGINNVTTEVAIYSIVNSLTELSSVNKVQILINGEIPTVIGASSFEKNNDLITTLDETVDDESVTETDDGAAEQKVEEQ